MKKILLGYVGVDSGQLLICDPCYIDNQWINENESKKVVGEFSYNGCCETFGQLNYKLGHEGVGVNIQNFGGDGIYPVYAKITRKGLIKKVYIKFN